MDGTEKPEGLSLEGQTSEGEAQGTSQATPKTYTEQEYREATQKAINDALAKAGRDHKSLSEREAAAKALEESAKAGLARIEEFDRQADTAELEEAKKDPAKMRAYQAKRAEKDRAKNLDQREADLKKREQEQARKEAETAETVRVAQEVTLGMKLYEVAAKYDLNPEDLKAGVKDLNLTTAEQAEALAKRMSTAGQRPPGDEGAKPPITPVTVPTSGGPRKDYASIKFDTNAPSAKDMIRKGLEKK